MSVFSFACIFLFAFCCRADPHLFITFHGGAETNVGIYSLNGWYQGKASFPSPFGQLFLGTLLSKNLAMDLRGMVWVEEQLLIASAKSDELLSTTGCRNPGKKFLSSKGLVHPYGLAYDTTLRKLYVSNQNGNNIVQLSMNNSELSLFSPLPASPRGIAVDPKTSNIVVGNSDAKKGEVLVLSPSGKKLKSIPMSDPIGVYISNGFLYISNKNKLKPAIYKYDINTFQLVLTIPSPDTHPTGVVEYDGTLYVLGQTNSALYSFNSTTGASFGNCSLLD